MIINYEFEGCDYEYEVEGNELRDALVEILLDEGGFDYTDTNRRIVKFMIDTFDLTDNNDSIYRDYYDYLYDYFEDDARDDFKDQQERDKDPLGYVGMSIHDFI